MLASTNFDSLVVYIQYGGNKKVSDPFVFRLLLSLYKDVCVFASAMSLYC